MIAATDDLFRALNVVAEALGQRHTFERDGRYSFPLGDGQCLCLYPDSAGRLRIQGWRNGCVIATFWSAATDESRLTDLARRINESVGAPA